MTSRDTWLTYARDGLFRDDNPLRDMFMREWVSGASPAMPAIRESFPRTARRAGSTPLLVEVVRDNERRPNILVSPVVSTGQEASLLVAYGMIRYLATPNSSTWPANRLTRAETRLLGGAGFSAPFQKVIPTDLTVGIVTGMVEYAERQWGEGYPDTGVHFDLRAQATMAPRQTTRMLRAFCDDEHDEYILRISRSQAERGRPMCGVCGETMIVEW